jgi:transmembrane sensor
MHLQRKIDGLLALRASEWFDLLPVATAEELRAFDAWLSESRLHVQEFLEIAEVEYQLQGVDPQRRHDLEALLARVSSEVPTLRRDPVTTPRARSRGARRRLAMVSAAACASIFAVIVAWWSHNSGQYVTGIGEQRELELADRSVVTLNADSKMAVHLGSASRQIDLLQGEAIFKVAHDAYRPFQVHARAGLVRAIGTQFDVYNGAGGDTRVAVLEGRVWLKSEPEIATHSSTLTLEVGQVADIDPDGAIRRLMNVAVTNVVAWRERRLVFDGASLEDMVAEFNRYNRGVQLRLEGIANDPRRYDGVFDATEPTALADLLARERDLVIEHRGSEIVIRKR